MSLVLSLAKLAVRQVKPKKIIKKSVHSFLRTRKGQELLLKTQVKLQEWEDALIAMKTLMELKEEAKAMNQEENIDGTKG